MSDIIGLISRPILVAARRIDGYPAVVGQVNLNPAVKDVIYASQVTTYHNRTYVSCRQPRCPAHGDVNKRIFGTGAVAACQNRRCSIPAPRHFIIHVIDQIIENSSENKISVGFTTDGFLDCILNYRVIVMVFFIVFKVFFFDLPRDIIQSSHLFGIDKITYLADLCLYLHFSFHVFSVGHIFKMEMRRLLPPFVGNDFG